MKSEEISHVAFSNNELDAKPKITLGEVVMCDCGHRHRIKGGLNSFGEESNLLMFYTCNRKTYLAGVSGKNVMGRQKNG
jgi:hypothetical protein